MALVYGDPGLGKSETALNYAANNGSLYIRMKKLMKGRWLLRDLVSALGSEPEWTAEDLCNLRLQYLAGLGLNLRLESAIYDHMTAFGPHLSPSVFSGSEAILEYMQRAIESGSSR